MAPHIQPKGLLQLTHKTIAELIIQTCINIDATCSFNEPEWQAEVEILQTQLVRHVPACEWDSVCNAVFSQVIRDHISLNDCRVLYASLVHRHMRKLKIKPLCQLTRSSRFYHNNLQEQLSPEDASQRDFWLQMIGRLANVEELDMMFIDSVEIYIAIGETCSNLECLTNGNDSTEFIALLENCRKLRFLRLNLHGGIGVADIFERDFIRVQAKQALETFPNLEDFICPNMAEVLETVEVNHPLNLRFFRQGNCSPLDISIMVPLCPKLQSLDIDPDSIHSSEEIFKILASSSLHVSSLYIRNFIFDENVKHFLENKGESIDNLVIHCFKSDLHSALLHIGKFCKNISTLRIFDWRKSKTDVANEPSTGQDNMFQQLGTFQYFTNTNLYYLSVLKLCLSQSFVLTSLAIECCGVEDEEMIALFNSKWVTQLTRLHVSGVISEAFLRHVNSRCPNLTFLTLGGYLDNAAICYFDLLEQEVRDNNLDLKMDYSSVRYH